jgi:hypothetical protein
MPCYYTGSAQGDKALYYKEALDKTTAMLCAVLSYNEHCFGISDTREMLYESADFKELRSTSEIADWWENHKLEDIRKKS